MSDDTKSNDDDKKSEDGAEGGESEVGKKGLPVKKLLIILVPLLLIVGGGAGAYFTGLLDGMLGKKPAAEKSDEHADKKDGAHGDEETSAEDGDEGDHATTDTEGDSHAPAADDAHAAPAADDGHGAPASDGHGAPAGGNQNFVKVADEKGQDLIVNLNSGDGQMRLLQLGVQLELANPADAPKIKAVMPRVIDQFQTYLRELRVKDLRGSAGIYRLQMELLARVNQAAAPVKVKDVLFEKILIQ